MIRLAYNPGPVNCYKAIRWEDWGGVRLAYHPEGSRTLKLIQDDMTVRLAMSDEDTNSKGKTKSRLITLQPMNDPSVRLAVCPGSEESGANSVKHHTTTGGLGRPTVRLAHVDGAQGDGALQGTNGFQIDPNDAPGLLVSYYYLEPFLKNRERYCYRDWVMDSGAFSAHNSGKKIDLQAYIDQCLECIQTDKTLTEVFALDVIGDPDASLRNTEEMWRQGVQAIPCFHQGEPEEHLLHMAKEYPKIALGGVALERGDFKLAWLAQCFARVWPKKIHGFGMSSEAIIYGLPFHSVDATNWEIAPCAFGNWQKFGQMSVRGSNQDLRSQVKYYLELEAKARVRWRKEMTLLDSLPAVAPSIRLAVANAENDQGRMDCITRNPAVRLAIEPHIGRAENNFTGADPTVRLAVDAGAAGGKYTEIAFQKPEPKPEPKPKKEAKKQPAEMDKKWEDYWKNRL